MLAPIAGRQSKKAAHVLRFTPRSRRVAAEKIVTTNSDFRTRGRVTATTALILALVHTASPGQTPQVQPGAAQPPYAPAYEQPLPGQAAQTSQSPSMRQLFAGTLAAVAGGLSAGVSAGLTNSVNGAIVDWFGDPYRAGPAPPGVAPVPPYGQQTPQDPYAAQSPSPYPAQNTPAPQDPYATPGAQDPYASQAAPNPGAGQSAYDPYAAQPQYPGAAPAAPSAYPPAYPDPYSQPAPASPPSAPQAELHAGIAYEVHALGPGGSSTPVDTRTRSFATGERFIVYYRTTLPGKVTVHNVNPHGQERRIDSIDVAAGQLATLGPYEFRDIKGDEVLRLHLTPCRTDTLILATRDIIKVGAPASGSALNLAECGGIATRSAAVRTRDIVKVGVEGSTSFAFDPLMQQELATGQFAPRELTIVFRHR